MYRICFLIERIDDEDLFVCHRAFAKREAAECEAEKKNEHVNGQKGQRFDVLPMIVDEDTLAEEPYDPNAYMWDFEGDSHVNVIFCKDKTGKLPSSVHTDKATAQWIAEGKNALGGSYSVERIEVDYKDGDDGSGRLVLAGCPSDDDAPAHF